ncbi:hypothetical protein [Microbacterium rhizomatis]|uniref:Uncharacterized protein n=1 Tax=Microbacterium rhizomatis TaxID=1631477 RepID=A0A5J5J2V1_9MICO|nr:hypothetical protein [Microbacterium rhizomatis]KAA9107733.1 hypothetical protein F6B43_09825 [Microbacterium rhizomatis]
MSAPAPHPPASPADGAPTSLVRVAIWVAIGALIAAALVCVVWVLVGSANGIIGRAFLTILLLAAFAGVAILDAHLAPRRPAWFALTSMIVWVVTLLIGAFMIWMPQPPYSFGLGRLFAFLVIVLILQLAVLHVRLYTKSFQRHVTAFTSTIAYITIGLVALLALLLVLPLMLSDYIDFVDGYWRVVVAITILAAVGTALIPLMNVLFAPKKPHTAPLAPHQYAPVAWPTYVDGITPLPVLPDGTPDWNAYYTGHPSTPPQAIAPPPYAAPQTGEWPAPAGQHPPETPAPVAAQPRAVATGWVAPTTPAPAAPPAAAPDGYQGYPPPPPLPPQQ